MTVEGDRLKVKGSEKWPGWKTWAYTWRVALGFPSWEPDDPTIYRIHCPCQTGTVWELRKADPEAKVSDVHPDDQIVFYIEKTVPVKFRRYVREGILNWT